MCYTNSYKEVDTMVAQSEIQNKEQKIEAMLGEIFKILNVTPTESNKDTAHRVAKMWVNEVFRNDVEPEFKKWLEDSLKAFPYNKFSNAAMIITTVPFHAFCEHHLLPFSGKVQLGYIPNDKIIGLSKIPRIVDFWCHTPQLQEKLCSDIISTFVDYLKPKFVCVRIVAEHSCVACRGIERECKTDTFNYFSSFSNFTESGNEFNQRALDDFFRRAGESL